MPLGRSARPSPASKLMRRPPTNEPSSPATIVTVQLMRWRGAKEQLRRGSDEHAEQHDSDDEHGPTLAAAGLHQLADRHGHEGGFPITLPDSWFSRERWLVHGPGVR